MIKDLMNISGIRVPDKHDVVPHAPQTSCPPDLSMADAGRRKDTIRHDELPMTIPQVKGLSFSITKEGGVE
ncbi:hypothetical protein DPMN_060161 [Dreissena polymorpha]|uniref:Uncharacterized protein n=1 Tax=Dreissena polymorpha TaxID=45954 RepID=A0A9D4C5C9_DREPO|nr:hypothetical protein DPMN_060161 [Dreissena polymorpha]